MSGNRGEIVRFLIVPCLLIIAIPFLVSLLPVIDANYEEAVIAIMVFLTGWFVPETGPSLAASNMDVEMAPLAAVAIVLALVVSGFLFITVNKNTSSLWFRSLSSIVWAILILEGVGSMLLLLFAMLAQSMGDPL